MEGTFLNVGILLQNGGNIMKGVFNNKLVLFSLCLVLSVSMVISPGVVADNHGDETEADSSEVASAEEVVELPGLVIVGTRAKPRSVLESTVPIDVVLSEDFVKQGGADLPDLLRNVVPSYNVNAQPIADAATVVRPANLRGLAPDHTLLLVNGKRRHRALTYPHFCMRYV